MPPVFQKRGGGCGEGIPSAHGGMSRIIDAERRLASGPATVDGMAGGENLRIGDAERDEAIALLREHMSAGRITAEEFDERMSAALTAKTRGELTVLFNDLPGRLPGDPHTVQTMPAPIQPVAGQHPARQSWYKPLAVVVVLAIFAMGLRHR